MTAFVFQIAGPLFVAAAAMPAVEGPNDRMLILLLGLGMLRAGIGAAG